jgi:DNA-binding beta-propeller fold protein YncE
MSNGFGFAAFIAPLLFGAAAYAAPVPTSRDWVLLQTIADPQGDARLDYAAIDLATRRLYVARGDGVTAVELDSGKLIHQVVAGNHVHAVVPLGGGRVLSTNGDSHNAIIFDGTGKILADTVTGTKPDGAILEPSSGLVFVMDGVDGTITLLDPIAGSVSGRIQVGGKLEGAVADGKGRVFVNIEDRAEVAVIDVARRQVTGHYKLPGCDGPTGLGLDLQSGVLVSACANRVAVALHVADGSPAGAALAIDRKPDAVIFDADRHAFLIPCGRDGTLAVIAESVDGALSVTAKIPTAVGAHTGALDAKTGRLYLPTASYHLTLSGIEPAPGSFRVLVFGSGR